jgi:GrpB-like predicted nucleotidyltransferase (UPF0157 family)
MPAEAVRIVEYARAWPSVFRSQRERVSVILAPWLAAPLEHIGSTSVPGLAAKPVIDMLGPVRSLDEAQTRCQCWWPTAGCSGPMTRAGTAGYGFCARPRRLVPTTSS